MAFRIIRDDITKVKADAIVNTANPKPVYGAGTDSAIYLAAGRDRLLAAREAIGDIETGTAKATDAFDLDAKYIIHTVGPVWIDGEKNEFEILKCCYENSLALAIELKCESIAFPLISTGSYGFPKAEALQIAVSVFGHVLCDNEIEIILVVFDDDSFQISEGLAGEIESFISENYVEEKLDCEYGTLSDFASLDNRRDVYSGTYESQMPHFMHSQVAPRAAQEMPIQAMPRVEQAMPMAAEPMFEAMEKEPKSSTKKETSKKKEKKEKTRDKSKDKSFFKFARQSQILESEDLAGGAYFSKERNLFEVDDKLDEAFDEAFNEAFDEEFESLGMNFHDKLFELIDEAGVDNKDVWKLANLDRKHFSKLQCDVNCHPKKKTVMALCIALKLDIRQAEDLLARADWAFSPSSKFDLIVKKAILDRYYDINQLNLVLFKYTNEILGV